jgi:hypothetical protein
MTRVSRDDLVAALRTALQALPAEKQSIRQRNPDVPNDGIESIAAENVARKLDGILQGHPKLTGNVMMRTGTNAISFTMMVRRILVKKALASSPEGAVDWLERVLVLESAYAMHVTPLWGIDVEKEFDLGNNLAIVPLSSVPETPQRQHIEQQIISFRTKPFEWSPPKVALIEKFEIRPLFCKSNDLPTEPISEMSADARLCLLLSGPSMIVPAERWSQFTDSTLVELSLFSGMVGQHFEIQPMQLKSLGQFDPQEGAEFLSRYLASSGEHRKKLRLALDRFDRAMRRFNPGDAAIETAVALETLVGDGQGELTWKIGLRSAILAGGSVSEKKRRRAIVHALYGLRNSVVHNGSTPSDAQKLKGGGKIPVNELVDEGIKTTRDVIVAALTRGAFPNWFDAEIEHL